MYATNNGDVLPSGDTIQMLLPQQQLLDNPFTKQPTEPQWGAAAGNPGETGYVAVDTDADGTNDGYTIDGMGKGGNVIITLTSGQ